MASGWWPDAQRTMPGEQVGLGVAAAVAAGTLLEALLSLGEKRAFTG